MAFFWTCIPIKNGSGDEDGGKKGQWAGDVKVNILPKVKSSSSEPCEDGFGGVGMEYDYLQVITKVPEGNPAAKAGIQIGDQIVTPTKYIRGPVGTEVTVEVMRNDVVHLSFTMKREQICQSL